MVSIFEPQTCIWTAALVTKGVINSIFCLELSSAHILKWYHIDNIHIWINFHITLLSNGVDAQVALLADETTNNTPQIFPLEWLGILYKFAIPHRNFTTMLDGKSFQERKVPTPSEHNCAVMKKSCRAEQKRKPSHFHAITHAPRSRSIIS